MAHHEGDYKRKGAPVMTVVAKMLGGDFELGGFIVEPGEPDGRPEKAARLLLDEIEGFPERRGWGSSIEHGRRFLAGSGGSAYIDSDHLEINTPEHLNSREHALHVHAGLRLARRAQEAVNARLPRDTRLAVLANNCDGHVSYGAHLNVMISRQLFQDLTCFKPHLAGFLATHLVTSLPYTGQGMVGAANGQPACDYQLSQRADWFEQMFSVNTMVRRPLINTRDESHAHDDLARLHMIYFDFALHPIANRLRAGTTQLVLALCEAGLADPTLLVDDPVLVGPAISRDLSLEQPFSMAVPGKRMTAVEIQQAILDRAGELVTSGKVVHAVPDAADILRVWQETLDLLRAREVEALAARCDNWMKFLLLDRCPGHGRSWQSAELKALDLRYSSLDPSEGLFFQMADGGYVAQMPSDAQIERAVREPPEDTRAYLRAQILRRWGPAVAAMDWSWIDFRLQAARGWWSLARLPMADPRRHTRDEVDCVLAECEDLEDLLGALAQDASDDRGNEQSSLNGAPPMSRKR
jgi:proteasome accessory factor A